MVFSKDSLDVFIKKSAMLFSLFDTDQNRLADSYEVEVQRWYS